MSMLDKNSGFTLIEVMIAVMVLSVGLLGVAAMQIRAIQANAFASKLTERTTIAEEKMEKLMSLPYDDANLTDTTTVGTYTTYNEANPPQGYTVTWEVDSNSPINNTKTVRVTVTWRDPLVRPVNLTFIRPNR